MSLRELEQMKRDSDQLKREVLAVAVAARNVTPAEVDDWLLRLPTIDVPLPARPGGTAGTSDKTTSLPLPRGTGFHMVDFRKKRFHFWGEFLRISLFDPDSFDFSGLQGKWTNLFFDNSIVYSIPLDVFRADRRHIYIRSKFILMGYGKKNEN